MNNIITNRSVEKWTLISTIAASSIVFIDFSALNVALPAIQSDLNISGKSLLWIINAYSLFLSSLLLTGGSLGDIYGRKKIFITGIAIFSIASFLCGISANKELLITSRAFQGLGGALMVPGSLAIISAVFPADRKGKAFGTWSTFSALTTIIGPILGGWLAGIGLWRVIFFINIPFAVFTIIVLVLKVPETKDDQAKKLDLPGAAFATLGLAGITYGFLEASERGFGSLIVQAALIIGVLSLTVFILYERKASHPMMPPGLFKSKTFSGVNALTLFIYAALSAALFFLPMNLIQVQNYPANIAGFTFLPFALLISGISRFSGIFADKYGAKIPLIVGPFIVGTGFLLLSLPGLTNGPSDYWTTYLPGLVFIGIGMGIVVAPLTAAIMSAVPAHNSGVASGVNNAVARTAGLLAIAVLGSFVILSFKNSLETQLNSSGLSGKIKQELINDSGKLAETNVPPGVSGKESAEINKIIKTSFIGSFRLINYISMGLAFLGAIIAVLFVEKGRNKMHE